MLPQEKSGRIAGKIWIDHKSVGLQIWMGAKGWRVWDERDLVVGTQGLKLWGRRGSSCLARVKTHRARDRGGRQLRRRRRRMDEEALCAGDGLVTAGGALDSAREDDADPARATPTAVYSGDARMRSVF